ncbi:dolichyl-phosphate-mannose--protein mannosyltransferase [Nocardioides sp. GCM10027113]|uniref:dolichyl-phosphate-mannose--protein mannosyltransferase n=1 Tax=unclassified Nocardioides TaxID=2615069 RepID=UPI00360C5C4D
MTTAAPPEQPGTRPVPPSAAERARPRTRGEDPLVAWSAAVGITLLAFFLRVWNLGRPDDFAFDETYYAKDAWALANFGYARSYNVTDNRILDGATQGVWDEGPSMVVHPELGKWLIALGEKAFGMEPFGWRIASAVVGSLMVLVMCRLARRLTGSTLLGCVAGLLLCFDGLHFVLSRLALLDIFVAFFLLCTVACLVNDRDWFRARMAARVADRGEVAGFGPVRGLLLRPWLLLGGVCVGLAVGTKWTALYPVAAFGLLVWAWSWGARRSFGVRWPVVRSALVDGVPAFLQLIVVGFMVYVATWTGWLVNAHEYETHLSATQYTHFDGGENWPTRDESDAEGVGEVWQSLRSLASYHRDVYVFHTHFLNDSEHTYASKPSGWLLLNRPVGVSADTDIAPGTQGCDAAPDSDCLRQVLLLGTPVLWWGGCLALGYAVLRWVGGRDWRFGLVVVGAASSWLPWLLYDDRPIFSFYAVVTLPFLVLAVTLAMGRIIGPSRTPTPRRTAGVVVAGTFFVLVLLNFAWFHPIYTHELLTHSQWLDRIWFDHWV